MNNKVKHILFLGLGGLMTVSCSQDILVDNGIKKPVGVSSEIEFGLSLTDAMTKASKIPGNSFVAGDAFSVDGFQTTGVATVQMFENQQVTYDGKLWAYSPIRYWNAGSQYDFYAFYPYSVEHTFNVDTKKYAIADFEVAQNPADQVDVMIAQRKINSSPYNTVDFVFNHLLSNVNFYMKASGELNLFKVKSIEIVAFEIEGLKSKGSFTQTDWNGNNAVEGTWTVDEKSVYKMPVAGGQSTTTSLVDLQTDLLMMPQTISDDAKVSVTYKLNYQDGTSTMFTREAKFANVAGKRNGSEDVTIAKWESKNRYNYYLLVNPSKNDDGGNTGKPNGTITTDSNDPSHPANVDIITKDTDGDGKIDEYWVDEDRDGTPDYPLVWKDPDPDDDDKTEYLYPDHDGDGIPDFWDDDDPHSGDTDGDGTPDNLWVDKDGDGESETEISRKPETHNPDIPPVEDEELPYIDYNGNMRGDTIPETNDGYFTGEAMAIIKDADGELWIDVDGDGVPDIKVVWKDVDGDGKLEGIADKDENCLATENDNYDGDHKDYTGRDNEFDPILIYDKNQDKWIELEKDPGTGDIDIPEPPVEKKPNGTISGDKDDPEHPADAIIIGVDTDGDGEPDIYGVDTDGDGVIDIPLVWDDPDGDGTENLYPDHDGDGIPDFRDPDPGLDPEGNPWTGDSDGDGNPDDLWIDTDGDGEAETEVSRTPEYTDPDPIPDTQIAIEFSATVEDWVDEYDANVEIKQQ